MVEEGPIKRKMAKILKKLVEEIRKIQIEKLKPQLCQELETSNKPLGLSLLMKIRSLKSHKRKFLRLKKLKPTTSRRRWTKF